MDLSVKHDSSGVLDVPLTLAEPPPRSLGLASNTAFWWNVGISLLLPVAAVYVVLPDRPLWASLLALSFDIVAFYEPFLFLIGSVFVPLVGGLIVAYYLLPRGAWGVSETAPARPMLVVPWAAGFVAYQLTLPTFFAGPGAGWTAWWFNRQGDLGIDPANGMSASLVSLGVAMVLTGVIGLPAVVRNQGAKGVR